MSEADRELMEAALRQLQGQMDYARLAKDLNMASSKSAWQRWTRFKTKLNKSSGSPRTAGKATTVTPQTPSKVKAPNRKRKAGKPGTPAKSRNIISSEDEDDDDLTQAIKTEIDISTFQPAFETPTRNLPERNPRGAAYKEESEAEISDCGFADSGHGGTPMEDYDGFVTQYEEEA